MSTKQSVSWKSLVVAALGLMPVLVRGIASQPIGTQASFPADASNLFNFLALRFNQTFSNGDGFLHCEELLGVRNPVRLQMTGDVVTGAVIDLNPGPAQAQGTGPR